MGKARRSTEGIVYFIHAADVNRLKIGFTVNLKQRLRELNNGSPVKLKLLRQVRGTLALEIALLAVFASYRLHGEWFKAHADIFSLINRLQDGVRLDPSGIIKK